MFSFKLDADVKANKYYLTLRNLQTKKLLCKDVPVQTDIFSKIADRQQASEQLKERICQLIRQNGANFKQELPECLKVI